MVAKEGLTSVALPRLATGVGSLAWEDVEPLIENQLADLNVPIVVYKRFVPGEKAQEILEV